MTKFNKRLLTGLACSLTLLATGCKEDNTTTEPKEPVKPTVTTTGIADSGMSFLYFEATPKTFTLTSDAPWEVTKNDGWFTITPKKGAAGEDMTISVVCSENNGEERVGQFTVTANSGSFLKKCLTEVTYDVRQTAYKSAGISISGLEDFNILYPADSPTPTTFSLLASYDWTVSLSDNSWVSASPMQGSGGATPTNITITPKANSAQTPNASTMEIVCTDNQNPMNTAKVTINLAQRPYYSWDTSHAVGAKFFEDDFNWIASSWVAPYSKYGFPTVTVDGTNNNEFASTVEGIRPAFETKGYTPQANVYARYEGYVKFGSSSTAGNLLSPAFAMQNGKVANLLVSFDGSLYSSAGGTLDTDGYMYVTIQGEGTFDNVSEKELKIRMERAFNWDKYSFIVYTANKDTKLLFGRAGAMKSTRIFMDNLKVVRAENFDPSAPDRTPVIVALDKEVVNLTEPTIYEDGKVGYKGAELKYSIRLNRAWSAASSDEWLQIKQVFCATAANGATSNSGSATVNATGLPYNNTLFTVEQNTASTARTATITIVADGNTVETITVTQNGCPPSADNIILKDITDDQLKFPALSPGVAIFKVTSNVTWNLTSNGGWFQAVPTTGAANVEGTVVVIPTENTGDYREGTITIVAGGATKVITVKQAAKPSMVLAQWSIPIGGAGTIADLSEGQWWCKSDDGLSLLKANRAGETTHAQKTMSYTDTNPIKDGDRLLIYGLVKDDWWKATVPVTDFAANTEVKITFQYQSSGTGPKHFAIEWSTDDTSWTGVELKAETVEGENIQYTFIAANAAKTDVSQKFTVNKAIASGNLYVRLRVSSTASAAGAIIGTAGTSRICRNPYTSEADKMPIMKIEKL